jgi:O-methyltransferase involved in polyketide biosynthesis
MKGLAVSKAIDEIPFENVSLTMLLMLYGRVMESRSADPIIIDPRGEEIVEKINDQLLASSSKTLQNLGRFKMSKRLAVHAAIRAKQYDLYTMEFMKENPDCTVVNLGCGMDTRFFRIDNGRIIFYDLDLPEVISFKQSLIDETERYKMLGCSIFDRSWLDIVLEPQKPIVLLAEGLFMYLPGQELKELLTVIAERINYGQLVAEVVHESYTRGFKKWLVDFKFKHELNFDRPVSYQFGVSDSDELERFSPRLKLINDWSYFDSESKKLGVLRYFKIYRKVQWTIRYQIGNQSGS